MNARDSMVQLLLDHGANIEAKDICRQTPLSLASENGRHATIRLLLDRGANNSMII
jgi:ankyrin repeat protein